MNPSILTPIATSRAFHTYKQISTSIYYSLETSLYDNSNSTYISLSGPQIHRPNPLLKPYEDSNVQN